MSAYDGHDDYDREFEPVPAGTAAAGFLARLFDVLIAGMAGLVVGRWTFFAMGPTRDWGGLAVLIFAMGAVVVAAVLAFVVLALTRNANPVLRLGLRIAIVLVFLVAFAPRVAGPFD